MQSGGHSYIHFRNRCINRRGGGGTSKVSLKTRTNYSGMLHVATREIPCCDNKDVQNTAALSQP